MITGFLNIIQVNNMNAWIFKAMNEILSAIIVIISFIKLFITKSVQSFVLDLFIFVGSIVILVCFMCYKRKYDKIYKLLLILSKNNKLHPIREFIMIIDKHNSLKSNYYDFKIKKAIFEYQILNKNENGLRNVVYNIEFHIDLSVIEKVRLLMRYFIKKIRPTLSFYAICENGFPEMLSVELEHLPVNKVKFEHSTLSGQSGDKSKEFAGLYECSNIEIPISAIQIHNQITILVKYKVRDQIIDNAKQYTFVIIPQNYGRKIGDIEIWIRGNIKSKPKLQAFFSNSPYYDEDKMPEFIERDNQLYLVSFIPSNGYVYIAQVEL